MDSQFSIEKDVERVERLSCCQSSDSYLPHLGKGFWREKEETKNVRFELPLVTSVKNRLKTAEENIRNLYYSSADIDRFEKEFEVEEHLKTMSGDISLSASNEKNSSDDTSSLLTSKSKGSGVTRSSYITEGTFDTACYDYGVMKNRYNMSLDSSLESEQYFDAMEGHFIVVEDVKHN
jgi:hypothetical protein